MSSPFLCPSDLRCTEPAVPAMVRKSYANYADCQNCDLKHCGCRQYLSGTPYAMADGCYPGSPGFDAVPYGGKRITEATVARYPGQVNDCTLGFQIVPKKSNVPLF